MNKIEAAKAMIREIETKLTTLSSLTREAVDEADDRSQEFLIIAQSHLVCLGGSLQVAHSFLERARASKENVTRLAQAVTMTIEEEASTDAA